MNVVEKVVKESRFTQLDLADASGLSRDTLIAWRLGRRHPKPSSLLQLADGLERHAGVLRRLSDEVRTEAHRRRK